LLFLRNYEPVLRVVSKAKSLLPNVLYPIQHYPIQSCWLKGDKLAISSAFKFMVTGICKTVNEAVVGSPVAASDDVEIFQN
jgi:hypothetical protein